MRFRGNIILQYSIATFIIIAAVSVALGVTLAAQITDYHCAPTFDCTPR